MTASDMSLPIIFWSIPEIRLNPLRKNREGEWGGQCLAVSISGFYQLMGIRFSYLNVGSFDEGLRATC